MINNNQLFQNFHNYMQEHFADMFMQADEFEKIGISLCLIPIVQPDLLENIIKQEFGSEGDFPLFGGIRGTQHRGILATGETWLYLCCGNKLERRISFIQNLPIYLSKTTSLLQLESALPTEPFLSGKLIFSNLFRHKFQHFQLVYEQQFTNLKLGNLIKTTLQMEDLVLTNTVQSSLKEIKYWQYSQENPNSNFFLKRIKPGLKVLFYGKSGTGKTQTASILGNEMKLDVFRIDLSQIVSKYIGETEKNLSQIFSVAERKSWILFFDEGDALFGKRTSVNSSNDRYANQEVSYLLQRIEDYSGIVIISTNLKENIDSAFLRRFQVIIEFQMPDKNHRKKIWQKLLSEINSCTIEVPEKYYNELSTIEISGAAITNIVNFSLLKAEYYKTSINQELLKEGLIRELRKENRLTSL